MVAINRLAVAFGAAGLIPFILGAILVWTGPVTAQAATQLFYLYSAGILAFMAGVYWPVGLQIESRNYPISPVSALVLSQVFFITAGLSLLLPTQWTAVAFPVLYLALYVTDIGVMKSYWPRWYLTLRGILTTVVILSQISVAVAVFSWMV